MEIEIPADVIKQLTRGVRALESIAASLLRISHPLMVAGGDRPAARTGMSMRERIAKAVAVARFGGGVRWDRESNAWRRAHYDIADAVLTELETPTKAMLTAGEDAMSADGGHNCEVKVDAIFAAMIAEARKS